MEHKDSGAYFMVRLMEGQKPVVIRRGNDVHVVQMMKDRLKSAAVRVKVEKVFERIGIVLFSAEILVAAASLYGGFIVHGAIQAALAFWVWYNAMKSGQKRFWESCLARVLEENLPPEG